MERLSPSSDTFSLSCVISALRERVGAWGARGVLGRALMFLLYRRLGEIGQRIERMMARFRAGHRLGRAPREAAAKAVSCDGPAVTQPGADELSGVTGICGTAMRPGRVARVWPGRFGWLVWAAGYEAAGLGSQLRAVLGTPDMIALLQASPQAARILRPLCRALAIETDMLRPGAVKVPRPPKPPRPARVRKPRPKIDFGRIPLPRGMLSAARRQGFGKLQ